MMQIAGGKQFSATNGLRCPAYENAVHCDASASEEILGGELMFGRNVGKERECADIVPDGFALAQVGQSNEHVIARI
jgi:hypothetical protein